MSSEIDVFPWKEKLVICCKKLFEEQDLVISKAQSYHRVEVREEVIYRVELMYLVQILWVIKREFVK